MADWFDERMVDGWITRDEVIRLRRGFDAEVTARRADESSLPEGIRSRPVYVGPVPKRPSMDDLRRDVDTKELNDALAKVGRAVVNSYDAGTFNELCPWCDELDLEEHRPECPVRQIEQFIDTFGHRIR